MNPALPAFAGLLLAVLPSPSAWAKTSPSGNPSILIEDRGSPSERRQIRQALDKLARSPTARRLELRRQRLGRAVVSFAVLSASSAPLGERLFGSMDGSADPVRVLLDERLRISSHAFVETLAHELYGHGLILPEARRAGADVGLFMENEAFSLTVGDLIASELGEATNQEDLLDAIAESTAAYYGERLFTQSPEKLELSRREAGDPVAAVSARLRELSRRRKSLDVRKRDFAVWKWQLDHFERHHGVDPRSVADLREALGGWMKTMLPLRQKLLDRAEPHLKECLAWFKEPEGRDFLTRMPGLSAHPYALALEAELAALGRELGKMKALHPGPPAEPKPEETGRGAKQLDWDDITRMAAVDRSQNPGHWRHAPETEPPVPWVLK